MQRIFIYRDIIIEKIRKRTWRTFSLRRRSIDLFCQTKPLFALWKKKEKGDGLPFERERLEKRKTDGQRKKNCSTRSNTPTHWHLSLVIHIYFRYTRRPSEIIFSYVKSFATSASTRYDEEKGRKRKKKRKEKRNAEAKRKWRSDLNLLSLLIHPINPLSPCRCSPRVLNHCEINSSFFFAEFSSFCIFGKFENAEIYLVRVIRKNIWNIRNILLFVKYTTLVYLLCTCGKF